MFESDDMKQFFGKCNSAGNSDFKKALSVFVQGLGLEFLRVIQDEIIRLKVIDTRLLLSSFHIGDNGNSELSEGDLTVEVGTNVEYAKFVNDGHWTCGKGEAMRFVPGRWSGNRFIYDPSAKSGMMLKQKWVEGRHFWESGIKIMEKMIPGLLEAKVQQWMDNYF